PALAPGWRGRRSLSAVVTFALRGERNAAGFATRPPRSTLRAIRPRAPAGAPGHAITPSLHVPAAPGARLGVHRIRADDSACRNGRRPTAATHRGKRMKHDMNRLSLAVRLALTVGALAVAGTLQAQDAANAGAQPSGTQQSDTQQSATQAPSQSKAKTLQGMVVTGSLIRRADAETSSPVVTIDRSNIDNSGKPTLGDVLQQLPSISGNATNTQNNSNGGGGASPLLEGGDGAARVSLRGLGETRTLVLIDGQRMANQDINMIPQNMIERVDVLAEGASTVYGSDAIGGVVNFILRKDFKGAQFSLNDGISGHGDSKRRGFNLTGGMSGDNYSIVGGLDYNKYDATLASQRDFSRQQLYLSSGTIIAAGSSSIPTGRIQLPASIASQYGCAINSSGTANVTLATGDGSNLGDYRCRLG